MRAASVSRRVIRHTSNCGVVFRGTATMASTPSTSSSTASTTGTAASHSRRVRATTAGNQCGALGCRSRWNWRGGTPASAYEPARAVRRHWQDVSSNYAPTGLPSHHNTFVPHVNAAGPPPRSPASSSTSATASSMPSMPSMAGGDPVIRVRRLDAAGHHELDQLEAEVMEAQATAGRCVHAALLRMVAAEKELTRCHEDEPCSIHRSLATYERLLDDTAATLSESTLEAYVDLVHDYVEVAARHGLASRATAQAERAKAAVQGCAAIPTESPLLARALDVLGRVQAGAGEHHKALQSYESALAVRRSMLHQQQQLHRRMSASGSGAKTTTTTTTRGRATAPLPGATGVAAGHAKAGAATTTATTASNPDACVRDTTPSTGVVLGDSTPLMMAHDLSSCGHAKDSHVELAATLARLAELRHGMGEYRTALGLWKEAHHLLQVGSPSPQYVSHDLAQSVAGMAAAYHALGDHRRSLELWDHALGMLQRVHKDVAHEAVAQALEGMARCHIAVGSPNAKAITLLTQALEVRHCLGQSGAQCLETQSALNALQ